MLALGTSNLAHGRWLGFYSKTTEPRPRAGLVVCIWLPKTGGRWGNTRRRDVFWSHMSGLMEKLLNGVLNGLEMSLTTMTTPDFEMDEVVWDLGLRI